MSGQIASKLLEVDFESVSSELKNGALICFIGIDGSGKTIHSLNLCKELLMKRVKCVYIRPRYAPIKFIPSVLRRWMSKHIHMSPRLLTIPSEDHRPYKSGRALRIPLTLSFLMYTFLTYLLIIKPQLDRNIIVCDRYFFDWFYNLWGKASVALTRLLPKPDLVFLLDAPVAVAFSRMRDIGDKSVSPEYYKSLRDWYLVLARQRGFFVIDSSGDFEKTRELVLNRIIVSLRSDV